MQWANINCHYASNNGQLMLFSTKQEELQSAVVSGKQPLLLLNAEHVDTERAATVTLNNQEPRSSDLQFNYCYTHPHMRAMGACCACEKSVCAYCYQMEQLVLPESPSVTITVVYCPTCKYQHPLSAVRSLFFEILFLIVVAIGAVGLVFYAF